MDCSVIIRTRNEMPLVMGTIHSFVEDLELSGLTFEIIVVDNMSDDLTAEILQDRFRRWVREKKLIVMTHPEPSTWGSINIGAAAASGDVLFVADAHISVQPGSCRWLYEGALNVGGLWHPAVQKWGDTENIRTFGYDLRLAERFWGDPCPHLPDGVFANEAYSIPMAGACLYAVRREQAMDFKLYDAPFRAYGGGETYLCMKWWMYGSAVYMERRALCRHAFGWRAEWKTAKKDKHTKGKVMVRSGVARAFTQELKKGEEYLSYEPGYKVDNVDFYYNFLLASALVGGKQWLEFIGGVFSLKFRDKDVLESLLAQVWYDALPLHNVISERATRTLNSLLLDPPWKTCTKHEMQLPDFVKKED